MVIFRITCLQEEKQEKWTAVRLAYWLIVWSTGGLDYEQPEVREHYRQIIREALEDLASPVHHYQTAIHWDHHHPFSKKMITKFHVVYSSIYCCEGLSGDIRLLTPDESKKWRWLDHTTAQDILDRTSVGAVICTLIELISISTRKSHLTISETGR